MTEFITREQCPLCGLRHFFPFRGTRESPLVCCRNCGLVFVFRVAADYQRQYAEDLASPFEYYRQCAEADRRTFRFFFQEIRAVRASGSVLDVGCATGTFLEEAARHHFEAYGLELNAHCLAHCRSKGLAVSPGDIEAFVSPGRCFDLIHLGDVVEHLLDPVAVLHKVHALLNPGGHVLLSTPNIYSPATRLFQIKPQEHLCYFSAGTIRRLLLQTGFKVVFVKRIDRWRDLRSLMFSSTFHDRPGLELLLKLIRRLASGSWCIRLPFFENLLAFAVKPGP